MGTVSGWGLTLRGSGADGLPEGGGNFFLLTGGDAVEEGQSERAAGDGFGNGQRGRRSAGVAAPGRLQMDGGKLASGGDDSAGERGLHAVAVRLLRQADDVDEPTDDAVGEGERREFQAWD